MKIYRAIIKYNNGDYDEWKHWFTETSPWYSERALAEKHLETLNQFRDYYLNKHVGEIHYECLEPEIEEQEITTEYTPFEFKNYKSYYNDEFKPLDYIPYNGECIITDAKITPRYKKRNI